MEAKILDISKKMGVTRSEIIKNLLKKFIEEYEKGPKNKALDIFKEAVQLYSEGNQDIDLSEIYERRSQSRGYGSH